MPHAGLLQSNSGEHYVIGNVCAELHDNVDIIIETEVHLMDQLGIKHKVVGRIIIKQRALEGVESREHVAHLELVLLKLMLQYTLYFL